MNHRLVRLAATLGAIVLASASLQAAALGASAPKFLTLPFAVGDGVVIQRAWWTIGATGKFDLLHHAIDYVKGTAEVPSSWSKFNALAAAGGEACGAKQGQTGCFDDGEIMGNRVLIKHDIGGQIFYTFYNHLDSIAKGIPLNNINKTVHVDAGQQIGVVGQSNSPGFIHLHFELLDANKKALDPYGIYGISYKYPDPKGKNGRLSPKKKNYFLTNPPAAFGATPKPSPSPAPSKRPGASNAPTPAPAASGTQASPLPGGTPVTGGSPGPGAPTPSSTGQPGGAATPSAAPGGSVPADPSGGGLGVVPIAIGIGVVVVLAILLGLVWISRRRRPGVPGSGYQGR